jgi:hypothetical protein
LSSESSPKNSVAPADFTVWYFSEKSNSNHKNE